MQHKSHFRQILKKPVFLFLIGITPILMLYSNNISQTTFSAILPSLALMMAASYLISFIFVLIFHKSQNKYIIALIVNLYFFSYGHIFGLLDAKSIFGIIIGRHAVILPVSLLATSVSVFLALRLRQETKEFSTLISNLILIFIFLFTTFNIALYQLTTIPPTDQSYYNPTSSNRNSHSYKPDIYYIIVDGFMREDVLKETYDLSDYRFPEELAKRGFVIPKCTHSNYGYTATSMASSLNMKYLESLLSSEKITKPELVEPKLLYSLLHKNEVLGFLKNEGYIFVASKGFFPAINFIEADVYLNYSFDSLGRDRLVESEFRELMLRTTLLRVVTEYVEGYPERFGFIPKQLLSVIAPDSVALRSRSSLWYQEHMYTLDKMETIPDLDGNIFAYIHLYTTHQPFVLNSDGSQKWPASETYDGYVDAVDYTSQRLINIIDIILAKSQQPPIIIIQGDHGYGVTFDRYKILNAYYLPNKGGAIYDTITPVNTFRIIFNSYFGQSFELLPDLIHFEAYDGTTYQVIPSTCND